MTVYAFSFYILELLHLRLYIFGEQSSVGARVPVDCHLFLLGFKRSISDLTHHMSWPFGEFHPKWEGLFFLKNDGVKVNGKDDIPCMKWKIKIHGLKSPTSIVTTFFPEIFPVDFPNPGQKDFRPFANVQGTCCLLAISFFSPRRWRSWRRNW